MKTKSLGSEGEKIKQDIINVLREQLPAKYPDLFVEDCSVNSKKLSVETGVKKIWIKKNLLFHTLITVLPKKKLIRIKPYYRDSLTEKLEATFLKKEFSTVGSTYTVEYV